MQVIVSKEELKTLNTVCATEFGFLKQFGIEVENLELHEVKLQGVTVADLGDSWAIEIAPEIAVRQTKAFGRCARIVAPLFVALRGAFEELFKELEEIQRWVQTKR